MSYTEKVLQPGETVIHRTGPHWRVYLPAVGCAVLALALTVLSMRIDPDPALAMQAAAALCAILALVLWLRGFIRRRTTELAVTDRRIIYKRGLIRRRTIEMSMGKVESVDIDQSLLGRLLDYGTVTIRGTGGGLEPLPDIEGPIDFRNHVTAG